MCTIQLNYAYSREREHDVYIETTSFIYCIYWLLVFHSENSFESIITLQSSSSDWQSAHYFTEYRFFILLFVETAMGISIDALSQPNSEYIQAVKE